MKSLFQAFFIELWPIWCGIGVGLIYLVVREIISIHKFLTEGLKFNEKINELDQEKRKFMSDMNSAYNGLSIRIGEIENINKENNNLQLTKEPVVTVKQPATVSDTD